MKETRQTRESNPEVDETVNPPSGNSRDNQEETYPLDIPEEPLPQTADEPSAKLKEKIVFPCQTCGADMVFDVGSQQLKCPYCAGIKQIHRVVEDELVEHSYQQMLENVKNWRMNKVTDETSNLQEMQCPSCGANVVFDGTLTSDFCPYCATPMQVENAHQAEKRVPTDGVLPIKITRENAQGRLKSWTASLWFAPNDFKKMEFNQTFQGVYLPFWTYDSQTDNRYVGERGEDYTVTVGTGKNRKTVRRTRWYPASGQFYRLFDDVLVTGTRSDLDRLLIKLRNWPLKELVPFQEDYLAGFTARTYDIELDAGFKSAKIMMDEAIHAECRQRIGGDHQRIHDLKTGYFEITYKLILLPVWILVYKYNSRNYQVVINGGNGQIAGDRPYSFWKILAFIFLILSIIAAIIGGINYINYIGDKSKQTQFMNPTMEFQFHNLIQTEEKNLIVKMQ